MMCEGMTGAAQQLVQTLDIDVPVDAASGPERSAGHLKKGRVVNPFELIVVQVWLVLGVAVQS
jgi:hypothetical protein